MEDGVKNLQHEKLEAERKAQALAHELRSMEMSSARILRCVEQNREQKFHVMEMLQEKVKKTLITKHGK